MRAHGEQAMLLTHSSLPSPDGLISIMRGEDGAFFGLTRERASPSMPHDGLLRKRRMHRVPMIGTARSVPSPAGRWERAAGAGAQCRLFFLSPKPPDAHMGHGACGPETYSLPGGRGSCFT